MRAKDAILVLVSERGPGKTCCPSEVARRLSGPGDEWRDYMTVVHDAANNLQATGAIALSWKGEPRSVSDGPYRIGLPPFPMNDDL
ncbi:MAG: DUF3253 domain-containing protein [Pontixanthobacter sp.]